MYKNFFFIIVVLSMSFKSHSEIVFTDKFTTNTNWKMITDQVMGGISQGQFNYQKIGDDNAIILTGSVSIKNNGGFSSRSDRIYCRCLPRERSSGHRSEEGFHLERPSADQHTFHPHQNRHKLCKNLWSRSTPL